MFMQRPWLASALLIVVLLAGLTVQDTYGIRRPVSVRPSIMLWAWERPEDLTFIDSRTTGVAFLAGTVHIADNGTFDVRTRQQPLKVKDHTLLSTVFRIEPDRKMHPNLSGDLASEIASTIASLSREFKASSVQIDFDARTSERAFYRDILMELRRVLPVDVSLSMTALASWCMHDRWLNELPVDEAVPMLFRMGPERGQILRYLNGGDDFREPLCRKSIGISTDEKVGRLPVRTRYIFSPVSWNADELEKVMQEVNR